jgi:hypothetical protein
MTSTKRLGQFSFSRYVRSIILQIAITCFEQFSAPTFCFARDNMWNERRWWQLQTINNRQQNTKKTSLRESQRSGKRRNITYYLHFIPEGVAKIWDIFTRLQHFTKILDVIGGNPIQSASDRSPSRVWVLLIIRRLHPWKKGRGAIRLFCLDDTWETLTNRIALNLRSASSRRMSLAGYSPTREALCT